MASVILSISHAFRCLPSREVSNCSKNLHSPISLERIVHGGESERCGQSPTARPLPVMDTGERSCGRGVIETGPDWSTHKAWSNGSCTNPPQSRLSCELQGFDFLSSGTPSSLRTETVRNHVACTPASGPAFMQNSSSLIVQKTAASKSRRTDEFCNVELQDPAPIRDSKTVHKRVPRKKTNAILK
jgi:hypothetical protein